MYFTENSFITRLHVSAGELFPLFLSSILSFRNSRRDENRIGGRSFPAPWFHLHSLWNEEAEQQDEGVAPHRQSDVLQPRYSVPQTLSWRRIPPFFLFHFLLLLSFSELKLHEAFISQSKEFYDSVPKKLTNDSAANVKLVNSWVANFTQNRIPELVDSVDESIEFILLNAVYFIGQWPCFHLYLKLFIFRIANLSPKPPSVRCLAEVFTPLELFHVFVVLKAGTEMDSFGI